MATRMQQRRGTASQWTSANPVLNAGELGWESDTNKFKIGDGTNHWADLDYFIDVNSTVNPAFGTSIVFEGATADSYETTLQVTDPTADRTITLPDATGTVVLKDSTDTFTNKSISLGTNTVTSTLAQLNTAVTDANLATTSDLSSYATLSGATFTGAISGTSLTLSGDLTINGTTTTINSTTLTVDDINITLGQGNTSDASANGGGITLEGATNKTFNWIDATDAWTSSEHMNLVTGKSYKINGTSITAAIPAGLTWGEVKDGKSGLVIS